jgi:hypothetical protein
MRGMFVISFTFMVYVVITTGFVWEVDQFSKPGHKIDPLPSIRTSYQQNIYNHIHSHKPATTNITTRMNSYSHNLKILILDDNQDVIDDTNLLSQIKERLCTTITNRVRISSAYIDITLKWDLKALNKVQANFMGDLFGQPMYEMDSLVYQHTDISLKNIEKEMDMKWKIYFHISRMPCDKNLIKPGSP